MSPYRSICSLKAILSNRELDLSLPTTTILRTPLAPRAIWVGWSLRSIAVNLSLYIDALHYVCLSHFRTEASMPGPKYALNIFPLAQNDVVGGDTSVRRPQIFFHGPANALCVPSAWRKFPVTDGHCSSNAVSVTSGAKASWYVE